ncbi:MAG: hypothetical protein WC971_00105 [Coriobacteriia bacterium]
MHPNLYLRTFWTSTFRPEVFVIMSFAKNLQGHFEDVIEPAIEAIEYRGTRLRATRVDRSKSGDCILTAIVDGIAHSTLVLADVSVVGCDAKSGQPYRNGNVMYEVGLALACRQSAEVLLVRDDSADFLFDVSTVPHKYLDFSDVDGARATLIQEIGSRLREVDHVHDARVNLSVASLTSEEHQILATTAHYEPHHTFWLNEQNPVTMTALPRLLDKQLIRTTGMTNKGRAMFVWTELGLAVVKNLNQLVPVVVWPAVSVESTEASPDEENSEPADGAMK